MVMSFRRSCVNESCSNDLADFGLRKGLDHLYAVRPGHHQSLRRLPGAVAERPCRLPTAATDRLVTVGAVRYPSIKIHDTHVIRLLERDRSRYACGLGHRYRIGRDYILPQPCNR